MITVITPTCDQPTGLALCEHYMARQTYPLADVQWIVVDDGVTPATLTLGQQHVRRPRDGTGLGSVSLCRNLEAALPLVTGDPVVIVEHDDWYAPTHLADLVWRLTAGTALIAGDDQQRYYHVGQRRWKLFQNVGASLCQTALRADLLPLFARVIGQCLARGSYGVDAALWRAVPHRRQALASGVTVVGIKGLPGRPGLGIGHRPPPHGWTPDPVLTTLRSWIGADADRYAPFHSLEAVPA